MSRQVTILKKLALVLWGAALVAFVVASGALPQLVMWVFAGGALVLLAITLGQLVALQRTILRPISTLAEAAELARTREDYTRRVPASGTDELARLGQSFNAMMEAIQQREGDLRRLSLFQRAIMDNAAYGISSTTPEGVVTSFNPAAERLLGYQAEEVVGKQTPALWHEPDEVARRAQQLSGELGTAIAPGFEVFAARARRGLPEEGEWTFRRKDGTLVPVLLAVTALRDERGQLTGFVGLTYDLTDRKRAEEALRKLNEGLEQRVKLRTAELQLGSAELQENQQALMNIVEDLNEKTIALEAANAKLEAVNRELEAFSYSVSHDLRAPLRSIDGFSRILLEDYEGKLDEDGKDSLWRVRAAAQRMGMMIEDLLNLSRVSRGESRCTPVDLSGLAATVAGAIQQAEPKRSFEFVIAPDLRATGDAGLLQIVIENLFNNAAKFSSTRPDARIEFGLTTRDGQPAYFVHDNGVGFDMTYAHKLFGVFQRLHSVSEFPGTGIGLATVRRIIHRHGGEVGAHSEPGQGATFFFTLPQKSPSAS
jgi:signal transduction histidine kinase